MLGQLSANIICSEKRTVFRERSSRKTVSYEEQIMSKDKYPNIFSPQVEAIVFIILQIFLQRAQFENHFISNKGEWNNCFSKFSNRVLPPIFTKRKFLNLAHYFLYDVKLRILAHSRSFLANQKARNAIFGAENLLISDIPQFYLGDIRSRDVFRPIARERKDLKNYNCS